MRASLFGSLPPLVRWTKCLPRWTRPAAMPEKSRSLGWTAASPASPSTSKAPVSPIRTPLTKLNRLAEKIDGMDERQRDIFSGALDAESAGSLDDVLRVSDSLEAYTFVPNVRSDEELGRYVVVAGQLHGDRRFPEEAWPYLDFAKIGAEYFAGHGGAYTVSGYVMRREDGQQQVQESKPIFELYLLHGQIRYRLDLPAEELQLDMTKRRLGVEDFAQAAIYQTKCEMEPLAGLLPMDCVSVESANELARTIREMPDGDLLKYLAVLSVEPPADFPGALRLALELDDYERITEGSYEYGQSVLRRIGADEELISVIDGYMDFEQFGEDSMKEDGVRQTEFGLVRRLSSPFDGQTPLQQVF